MKNIENVITGSLLFAGLSEEHLAKVVDITVAKEVGRGETVFFEGDVAIGFYMMLEGKIKIFKTSFVGREQILHVYGPSEPFGEVPVFHGSPYPANAVSLGKGKTLFFPRKKFIDLVHDTPSIALNMLAMLSMRLRQFAAQIENLSLKEVPGRLASHLLYLSEEQGSNEKVILDIPKGQLASLLGTTPETLSRIFAKMSGDGIVRISGRDVEIVDMDKLLDC
jgi:CRP/FNR family transcriptional regulator